MPADLSVLAGVGLSTPGRYLHWSVFIISEANLVLIAVMVVIFAVAIFLPFPRPRPGEETLAAPGDVATRDAGHDAVPEDADPSWTARVRRRAVHLLPPDKLLPDRQPAYVASWVYVFGVASLAALAIAIASGAAIALGGPGWWHHNPIGHFFNSLHLWSVELFMAVLVIHLWGKFWMASWRGRRQATWITGVIAFVASVIECFTGYLSQTNFDSQWISTNGKDAFNAVGVGAFFDLMNFGQMLLWHVVLMPLVLVAVVALHVLLVRVRGVSQPIEPVRGAAERRAQRRAEAAAWRGPTRRYDLVKEASLASVIVLVIVIALASVLSSPDAPALTVRTWSTAAPADFMATAANELAGTSETARYGPPYNAATGRSQKLVISWATLAGIRQRIDAAATFVLNPLQRDAVTNPTLARALATYRRAGPATQRRWDHAYLAVLPQVRFRAGTPLVPAANDGPVPILIADELRLGRSGALDAELTASPTFYGTNYTKPLLFIEDGAYFAAQAHAAHLTGNQWGVMNETGSYPGQPWLWLYQLWYELPGFRNSGNVDLIAIYLTGVATVLLAAVPFVPGLRDLPRVVPLHRLIWRQWYERKQRPDDEVA